MLSDALQSQHFDEFQPREALKELFQMSLILANPDPKDDSYSMHPAAHLWLRERPEMTAVEGLKQVLGDNRADTLAAMGNLGRAVTKDFKFTEAVKIQSKVFTGLHEKLGSSHLDSLIAMDDLVLSYFDRAAFGYRHRGYLDNAVEMEQEVFEQRKEKFGRAFIYSLGWPKPRPYKGP